MKDVSLIFGQISSPLKVILLPRVLLLLSVLLLLGGCEDNSRLISLENRVEALEKKLSTQHRVAKRSVKETPAKGIEAVSDIAFGLSGNEKDDPFLGNSNAPLTMFSFIDFTSKASREFVSGVVEALRGSEIARGDLRLIVRDFPTTDKGIPPAITAHCAGEQGKYWQFFDSYFQTAGDLPRALEEVEGLNKEKFKLCQDSSRYLVEIERDVKDARLVGVKGVPASFIGRCTAGRCTGKFIRGAQPLGVFQGVIRDMIDNSTMR